MLPFCVCCILAAARGSIPACEPTLDNFLAAQLERFSMVAERAVRRAHNKAAHEFSGLSGLGNDAFLSALYRVQAAEGFGKRPRTFIDVGANKGFQILPVLERWGSLGQRQVTRLHPSFCHERSQCKWPKVALHAIDLNPDNVRTLQRTVSELVHVHLASQTGLEPAPLAPAEP